METLQSWAWDPQAYNSLAGGAIYSLMAREFAPLPERMKSATVRMETLPRLFAQMRENIDPARVPKIHAETVAKQNSGVISLVEQFIVPNADKLQGDDRKRLDAAIEGLRTAVAEHQLWLDKTLVPNAKGDFRIGQFQRGLDRLLLLLVVWTGGHVRCVGCVFQYLLRDLVHLAAHAYDFGFGALFDLGARQR